VPLFEYAVNDEIRTVTADGYRTEGRDTVFWETHRDPASGAMEQVIKRVKADANSIVERHR
jgi:hypothetical protein